VTEPIAHLVVSDAHIRIHWYVHARLRYETDCAPDVDNIIKPLLDGLCGPKGILIDDCQVASVHSGWIDAPDSHQSIEIEVSFSPRCLLIKDRLIFAQVMHALCYPVPRQVRERSLHAWLDIAERSLQIRDQLVAGGIDYYQASSVLPSGFFHKSRLKHFDVIDIAQLRAERA